VARKPAGHELLDGVQEWSGVAHKEEGVLAREFEVAPAGARPFS